jgi:hypothetical protein
LPKSVKHIVGPYSTGTNLLAVSFTYTKTTLLSLIFRSFSYTNSLLATIFLTLERCFFISRPFTYKKVTRLKAGVSNSNLLEGHIPKKMLNGPHKCIWQEMLIISCVAFIKKSPCITSFFDKIASFF